MAFEDRRRFVGRQRIRYVMKVDARHQLRGRHVGEHLPYGLAFGLCVEIPQRVDDSRECQMNDAFFWPQPPQLRFPGKAVPERTEIRCDVAEIAADDEVAEGFDGG